MISITKKLFKYNMIQEAARFGVIGLSAAVVNFLAVLLLVHFGWLSPLVANIFAFLIAFQVSFFGHKYWSFKHDGEHLTTMSKFLLVAIASFFLNEASFAFFLHKEHLIYPIALLITLLIVPPITFTASKLWAFRS